MSMMTVRNIPDAVHNALRARAKAHHRSTEAEVRALLEQAVRRDNPVRFGDELSAIGRNAGLTNEDCEIFDQQRDKTPAEPMTFGS